MFLRSNGIYFIVFGGLFFLRVFVTADMLVVEVYDLVKSLTFDRLFGTSLDVVLCRCKDAFWHIICSLKKLFIVESVWEI